MPRNALGRGLGALIREQEPPPPPPQQQPVPQVATPSGTSAAAAPALDPTMSRPTQAATPHPAPPIQTKPDLAPTPVHHDGLIQLDIDLIDPSPYQPRTRFREVALDELARSITSSGI